MAEGKQGGKEGGQGPRGDDERREERERERESDKIARLLAPGILVQDRDLILLLLGLEFVIYYVS